MHLRLAALAMFLLSGCAPMAAEHQADASFRRALSAQLASQDDAAELEYRQVIALGFNWSPVWNNLAVIAARRHEYRVSRHLLAQAVSSNDRDPVALTNYGVMSFYLSDFREARRTLVDAQQLRHEILNRIPPTATTTTSTITTSGSPVAGQDRAALPRAHRSRRDGRRDPVATDVIAALQPARF